MSWDNLTFEEREEKARKTESILEERVTKLKEAQANFELWDGFRIDEGYAADVKKAEGKLQKHIDENMEYLI